MTKIEIKKIDNYIISVECRNHTGFAESGKDIVCAGISCITQTAILGVQNIAKVKSNVKIDDKIGYLKLELISFKKDSPNFHDAQVILKTMLCGLEDLERQYPKNLKVEVK